MEPDNERLFVLHIQEMILYGLPYAQRYAIAAAVEGELQRLLDEVELPPEVAADLTLPEVQIGDLRLAAGAKAGEVGAQIAASIYNSLSGGHLSSGAPGRSQA
jgi:hypothetical protein